MRRYVLYFVLAITAAALTGCCGDGVALSRSERKALHKEIRENDRRQVVDDWDAFWLNERKGRLSWWKIE